MSALPIYHAERGRDTFAPGVAHGLYRALYTHQPSASACDASQVYLDECLQRAATVSCDLPSDWTQLEDWVAHRHETVGRQYLDYLSEREAGAPRRYFANRSHALYFLQGVAPTKHVDGSWLAGLLSQWWDDRYRALIRIYLE